MRTDSTLIHRRPSTAGFTLVEILVTVSIILILVSIGVVAGTRMQANARMTEAKALMLKLDNLAEAYTSATADNRGMGTKINHSAQNAAKWEEEGFNEGRSKPIDWFPDRPCTELEASGSTLSRETGSLALDPSLQGNLYKEDRAYDLQSATEDADTRHSTIERFVWTLSQMTRTRELLLQSVGHKYLKDLDKDCFHEIVDPWGRPVYYAAFVDYQDNIEMDDFLAERRAWRWGDDAEHDYEARPSDIAKWQPFFVSAGPDGKFGSEFGGTVADAFEAQNVNRNDANLDGEDDRADNLYSYDLDRHADEVAEFEALED